VFGVEVRGTTKTVRRFFQAIYVAKGFCEPEVGEGIVRIEADDLLQTENGLILGPYSVKQTPRRPVDIEGIRRQLGRAAVGSHRFLIPAVCGEKISIGFVDPKIVRGEPQRFVKAISNIFGSPLLPGLAELGYKTRNILRRQGDHVRGERKRQHDSRRDL
jgi:hypothetical protein